MFAQLQEWSPRSQIFRHWHPPIHSLKNKKITRFISSSYHKHTCKKIYNLNFPVQHPRSNSTIGNPDESSSVSSEKHHVYCFPSVPLIIKIKGYKTKTTKHVNKMYFVIVANGRRLQTAFPIKLITNSARFLCRHQNGMWKSCLLIGPFVPRDQNTRF